MTIVVLGVGVISIMGTTQFVLGQDGSDSVGSVIGCVYAGCKNTTISGGGGGGGGGGEPGPVTAKLIVKKVIENCPDPCPFQASDFTVVIDGNNPSKNNFPASTTGTEVTLDPTAGQFRVDEDFPSGFQGALSTSADCAGTIAAGETKTCTLTNTVSTG